MLGATTTEPAGGLKVVRPESHRVLQVELRRFAVRSMPDPAAPTPVARQTVEAPPNAANTVRHPLAPHADGRCPFAAATPRHRLEPTLWPERRPYGPTPDRRTWPRGWRQTSSPFAPSSRTTLVGQTARRQRPLHRNTRGTPYTHSLAF